MRRVGIEVVRIGGNIGAEIRGVDLSRELSGAEFSAIHDAPRWADRVRLSGAKAN